MIDIPDTAAVRTDAEAAGEAREDMPELSTESASDPLYREAARLMTEKKWDEAEKRYRAILARGATSQTHNDLGVLYYHKGDRQKALEEFNRALRTKPAYPRAYFNRGLVYSQTGRYAEAVKDYEALIARMPHHFEAHYNLGVALTRLKDYRKAAAVLEKASEKAAGERKARALYNLGIAYRSLGPDKKEQARKSFEAAIRLKPDSIEPRFGLASLEPNTPAGRKRAQAQIDKALELKPNYPPAYFNLGLMQTSFGDRKAAEDAYRKAIQYNPEYAKARYNLGLLLLADKRWAEARAEFQWILKRDPLHAESRFNLGRAAYGEKDHDGALREYRKALDLRRGDYPEAHLNIGLVRVARKEYAEAVAGYRKAIKLREAYPEAWYNLGLAYMRQKQWDNAAPAFKTALKHEPNYEQAWFNLGILYTRWKKEDEAIAAYQKALVIRPGIHRRGSTLPCATRRRSSTPKRFGNTAHSLPKTTPTPWRGPTSGSPMKRPGN